MVFSTNGLGYGLLARLMSKGRIVETHYVCEHTLCAAGSGLHHERVWIWMLAVQRSG